MTVHGASERAETLSAELEAALLRELGSHWEWENRARFGGRLVPAVIVLSDAARLGLWRPAARTIELGRALVLARPWPEVMAVLGHEMAHQFVDEVLGVRDETAHGESFRKVCRDRGLDARAAGLPAPGSTLEVDRVLERIRKLLALAGSPNQHEAEIAMRRAHELMLRHNLERTGAATPGAYEVHHLGDAEKRGSRVEAEIMGLLAEYFFVKVIRVPVYLPRLGKRGWIHELAGTRPNLEMAAHVHGFLLATADRLWRTHRRDARVRSGRDRLSFQSGVIRGFRDKLQAERTELRGVGLIWLGDRGLDGFYRARNPRITTRRQYARTDGAHAAGREAGRKVVLHAPVGHGPSGERPRLLGRGG